MKLIQWIILAILDLIIKPTPQPVPVDSDIVQQLLDLHNEYRKRTNLPPLVLNEKLTNAAQKHSKWMADHSKMDHSENGVSVGRRVENEGYSWQMIGENIAAGYTSPHGAFAAWINSPGHKANILNPNYKDVGFGMVQGYWTADFGRQRNRFFDIFKVKTCFLPGDKT